MRSLAITKRLFGAGALMMLAACGSSAPIAIRPTLPDVAASRCPRTQSVVRLANVEDRRGYSDPRNVGFTQTGMSNVKASLELELPAAKVVEVMLARALARCAPNARAAGTGAVTLRVEVLRLQIDEETGMVSETMRGEVRYEVEALDASSHVIAHFSAQGRAESSGIDTTDDADEVISGALEASLPQFLAGIARLPAARPASVPAPVAETEASNPQRASAQPRSAAPALPLRVTTRRLTDSEQKERFGTTFSDKQVLAMELILRRVPLVDPHALGFRRQHFRITFADRAARFPLDPLKVQERNRGRLTTVIYAGGVFIPYSTGVSVDTEGLEKSVEQLVLPAGTGELRGLLFFDLEGVTDIRPQKLEIEYDDLVSHERKPIVVTY